MQKNYFYFSGSAFIPALDCREEKHYDAIKDSLYYRHDDLKKAMSALESKHYILIQGEQGSGKTILALKIADLLKAEGVVIAIYYLSHPRDWDTVKEGIQSVRFQEKINNSEAVHLWIVDNLQKIPNAIEEFPDPSIWDDDYCICCTRDFT